MSNKRISKHSGQTERAAYRQQLRQDVAQAAAQMQTAIATNDDLKFQQAATTWGQFQELWLIVAQHMTPDKARAVMVGFTTASKLHTWAEHPLPGPPPCIFDLYDQDSE